MSKINLPADNSLNAVPVAKPSGGSDLETSLTATTATGEIDVSDFDCVNIHATADVKVKVGDSGLSVASDDYSFFLKSGGSKDISVKNSDKLKIYPVGAGIAYIHGWK